MTFRKPFKRGQKFDKVILRLNKFEMPQNFCDIKGCFYEYCFVR